MLNAAELPAVGEDEGLARFVLQGSHYRADLSVKPDAFMPPPNLRLSVTRLRGISEAELWAEGRRIAAARPATLHGRTDVAASDYLGLGLAVNAAPVLPENPNHANVEGWPADKPTQKRIAQQLAAAASDLVKPPG